MPQSRFETTEEPPVNAATHFAAGQLAESQNDSARALEQYRKAIKLNSRHLPSLYRMGVVYAELKQYPQAIETWKQYIKAADGSAVGYSNLGFCCELAGRFDEAEAAYRKGIEKDPKSRPCRINYGLMLARSDHEAEATTQLQAVLTPAEVHYNLGSVYELRGKIAQAREEYQKALSVDPGFADARTRLGGMRK